MKNKDVENFLKEHNLWGTQCFNIPNTAGDPTETIYNQDGIQIELCEYYDYYEIFGLDEEDFKELWMAHFNESSNFMQSYYRLIKPEYFEQ